MARQLVVLLDGTNNRFSHRPTNVVHLLKSLDKGQSAVLSFYDQGVGTFGLKETLFEWQKLPSRIFGLAFGWGLDRIVSGAYTFLAQNYKEGDEIYIFGFSRGAYAARALAALIRATGLVAGHQTNLFDYAWGMLRARNKDSDEPDFKLQAQFTSTFGRKVSIRFLGLFDTVSSCGWIYDPLILPHTKTNKIVDFVRHAVSIDERRCFFRQNLWSANRTGTTNVKEVWFAGVHSDVGGGYPPYESQAAQTSLRWMMGEAQACGLKFDLNSVRKLLASLSDVKANPLPTIHDSMTFVWKIAEWIPRRIWSTEDSKRHWHIGAMPPFGRPRARTIPDDAQIHRSVQLRLALQGDYHLPNVPQNAIFVDDTPVLTA